MFSEENLVPMEASALSHASRRGLLARRSPVLKLEGDERLVALIRAGNDRAFEVLFDRYQSRLLAFCNSMLKSRQDAEDVLQEVFVNAHAAMLADERKINVRPWLYRIARNRCLNHLRRPVHEGQDSMDIHPHMNGATTAERVQDREELRQVLADVGTLPETQRTALLLREIDQMSYDEIAVAMDTTIPAVKSLLVRARITLAESSEARTLSCEEVRVTLAEAAEGLTKASGPVRMHVRSCESCTNFRKQLRSDHKALAAILPIGPLALLKGSFLGKLFGGGAATQHLRRWRCRHGGRRRLRRNDHRVEHRPDRRRDRHQGRRRHGHGRAAHRRRRRGQPHQRIARLLAPAAHRRGHCEHRRPPRPRPPSSIDSNSFGHTLAVAASRTGAPVADRHADGHHARPSHERPTPPTRRRPATRPTRSRTDADAADPRYRSGGRRLNRHHDARPSDGSDRPHRHHGRWWRRRRSRRWRYRPPAATERRPPAAARDTEATAVRRRRARPPDSPPPPPPPATPRSATDPFPRARQVAPARPDPPARRSPAPGPINPTARLRPFRTPRTRMTSQGASRTAGTALRRPQAECVSPGSSRTAFASVSRSSSSLKAQGRSRSAGRSSGASGSPSARRSARAATTASWRSIV